MPTRKPGTKRKSNPAARPPAPPDRRSMEQQMDTLGRLLAEQDFSSIEEANAFLQQVIAGGALPARRPQSALEEAQDLIYQALEATGKRRQDLARRALRLSPDCADAYVLLAEVARDPQEARTLYEQGVQAGERAIGAERFRTDVGHFWGMLDTRPYMRARQGLAEVLWHVGEHAAAIAHLQDMLRLNPNDNQGLRYSLAAWLLTAGDDAALATLLAAYPDEGSAHWAYTRALTAFRRHGAGATATQALQAALKCNPHVPRYLLGQTPFPKQLPAYYSPGEASEALVYLAESAATWLDTPGALEWLIENVEVARPSQPTRAPRRPRPS